MSGVRAALFCAVLLSLNGCSQREVRSFTGYAEGEYVKVAAPLSGNLARVDVRRGETVAAGETLFSLEAANETRAQRETQERVKAAQAQLASARKGGQPEETRDAERALVAAQAELTQLQWRLDQKVGKAPSTGLVVEIPYAVGQYVEAGLAVVSILSPESIKVRFFVPPRVASSLRHGQIVQLRCPGCGTLNAEVAYVSPLAAAGVSDEAIPERLRFLVEARPVPATALQLRPGQPVEVVL
jgi:HlyD family secretion protein